MIPRKSVKITFMFLVLSVFARAENGFKTVVLDSAYSAVYNGITVDEAGKIYITYRSEFPAQPLRMVTVNGCDYDYETILETEIRGYSCPVDISSFGEVGVAHSGDMGIRFSTSSSWFEWTTSDFLPASGPSVIDFQYDKNDIPHIAASAARGTGGYVAHLFYDVQRAEWAEEVIGGETGLYPQIAINQQGDIAVCYSDRNYIHVKVKYSGTPGWVSLGSFNGAWASIDWDPDGQLVAAYSRNGSLICATHTFFGWVETVVDDDLGSVQTPLTDIEITPSGKYGIAYIGNSDSIMYACKSAVWVKSVVDSHGFMPNLAFSEDGMPYIAYYKDFTIKLAGLDLIAHNPADFNHDKSVDFGDFAEFSGLWNRQIGVGSLYDLAGDDGQVTLTDLLVFISNWLTDDVCIEQ